MADMKLDTNLFRVQPGSRVKLSHHAPADVGGWSHEKASERFQELHRRLVELQELLYADGRFALLTVLQAMDGGGKDSTIRHVLEGVNPQGCRVSSFKEPSSAELAHDYLRRVHAQTPAKGMMGVFNRSHYEDVLIVRVHKLVPPHVWKKRYQHIRDFERMLSDEGTHIVKFFLHISKAYQLEGMRARLEDPRKHWKFSPADLKERRRWGDYQRAYEDALAQTSTEQAPWYIVPAEKHWFRNLLVTQVLVERLEAMRLKFPKATYDPGTIVLK
jgi:PPK2 family polyphosphate:nucleotide phosphotransferase